MIHIFQGNSCAIIDTKAADRQAMSSGWRGLAMNVKGMTKPRDQLSGIVVETCQLAQVYTEQVSDLAKDHRFGTDLSRQRRLHP